MAFRVILQERKGKQTDLAVICLLNVNLIWLLVRRGDGFFSSPIYILVMFADTNHAR